MNFTTRDYRHVIFYAACFLVAVMVVSGIGILSNVGSHAVDQVLTDDTPDLAQNARIVVVGMFNKVTLSQIETKTQTAEAADHGGLFGLTSTDYAILAVFMAILAVFVVTVGGVWLFFSPEGWED